MVVTAPPQPSRTTRRRATAALFTTAAAMNAAMATASPVATILAADRLGTGWGGLPNTAATVGTGLGALLLTAVTGRRGWRFSLSGGYLTAIAGALVAMPAVVARDIALLSLAMVLLGVGNAGALLARYAVVDHYPARRRGFAMGVVVWAGAVGAVGGPLLLAPTGAVASRLGWVELSGPFILAAVTSAVAAVAMLTFPASRPEPAREEDPDARQVRTGPARAAPARELLRASAARPALAVMATAQVVMVAVMTVAPLDLHRHHHGLGPVGAALAAHTLGMFVLSPLTGRLLDRFGARRVMPAGLVVLAASAALAAVAPRSGVVLPALALFLLGYGWNLCFIGGSGALAGGLPDKERTRVEGGVDAAVWGAAAMASVAATAVFSAGGQALLGWAAALVVLPAVVLLRWPGVDVAARAAATGGEPDGSRGRHGTLAD